MEGNTSRFAGYRALLVFIILTTARSALAQTGAELLFKPWPKEQQVQTQGDVAVANHGSTDNSPDFDLAFYDTSGRVRLLREERADPRFGWNYTQFHTS